MSVYKYNKTLASAFGSVVDVIKSFGKDQIEIDRGYANLLKMIANELMALSSIAEETWGDPGLAAMYSEKAMEIRGIANELHPAKDF